MANKASITVELVGVKEAVKSLNGFSKAIRYRVTRDAVNKGAGILRDGVRRNVPTETKLLKNNLVVRTFVPKNDSGVYCKIGARRKIKKAVYVTAKGKTRTMGGKRTAAAMEAGQKLVYRSPSRYLHLVEHGTKNHFVTAKNAAFLSDGRNVFGMRVEVRAKPRQPLQFTARSLGKSASAATVAKIKKEVDIEARKAASKAAVKAVARVNRRR